MEIIVTEKLTKWYGPKRGITGVSLAVPRGCLFGFIGPNGAGKTTTIRLLLALLRASEGQASIFGRDCWREAPAIKEEVGYVPGDLRLYPWLSARNALSIVGKARGRRLMKPGLALAERFRLDPDVCVTTMSRGMRQKLGLIIALAHNPQLLILDEPTSGLDPLMQQDFQAVLRERSAAGVTIFLSSHTLREVQELCERVAVIRRGEIVTDEPLEALRSRAQREVVLIWKRDTALPDPPPFLEVLARDDTHWRCTLSGPTTALLQWGAAQPLEDLTITPPDLDSLFRRFYREEPS